METIKERVKMQIAEICEVDLDEVTEEADFIDDLGADSLKALELLASLEKEFGIKIPETSLKRMTSLKNTMDVLRDSMSAMAEIV